MKILKHGNTIDKTYKFTCKECGCEFELNHYEFTRNTFSDTDFATMTIKKKIFKYSCPECMSMIREYYNA